ncbi:hypothetical protein J6O86_01070 [bacterium]|nr:hypothetical protein [bacterium]
MKIESSYKQFNTPQQRQAKNAGQFKNSQNPNFTGFSPVELLKFLDTSPAWGANAVDFFCMVLPRTLTDFSRGPEAGIETARRESMGTINDSAVGAYGTLAGLALAMGINKAFGLSKNDLKAASIFADSETIDMMGKIWHEELPQNTNNPTFERIKKALGNYEVYDGNKWAKFNEKDIEKAANIFVEELGKGEKLSKEARYNINKILTSSNNLENNFRIVAKKGEKLHSSRYSIDGITENTFKLSKIFSKDKVAEAFREASDIGSNKFLKALKKMNMKRSILGVLIATLVGCSVQPINMWLTKRKTGGDGFVGGGKKDDSFGFKVQKALVAGLFSAGVIATIGNPKNLLKNLQFKGFTPTINQLKFIYGATIASRFLSARNENELKESTTKDVLGFVNWLILGNFVQKLVAQGFDKSLIKQEQKGGILNWIRTSSLKTRDEVLHEALGEKAFKDGKALKFGEMIKALGDNKAAKKRLGILTLAQLAGYIYSGVVLGVGIPKLNIYLTKRRMEKEAQANASAQQNNPAEIDDKMLSPENREFLNQKNFTGKDAFSKVKDLKDEKQAA